MCSFLEDLYTKSVHCDHLASMNHFQYAWALSLGLYSPTILRNAFCFVLQIFLYLAAFECNTTSNWLNHLEVVLHSNLQNLDEKD